MKTVTKKCRRPISAMFWLWVLDKLGYETEVVFHIDPFGPSYIEAIGRRV